MFMLDTVELLHQGSFNIFRRTGHVGSRSDGYRMQQKYGKKSLHKSIDDRLLITFTSFANVHMCTNPNTI